MDNRNTPNISSGWAPSFLSMYKHMAMSSFPQSLALLARTRVATYILHFETFKLRYLQICFKNPFPSFLLCVKYWTVAMFGAGHSKTHYILRTGEKKIKSSLLLFQFETLKLIEITDTTTSLWSRSVQSPISLWRKEKLLYPALDLDGAC